MGSIEHPARQSRFEVSKLRRAQVVIEEHEIGMRRCRDTGDLFNLALTDQRRRIRPRASLQQLRHDLTAGTSYQLTEFRQRLLGVERRE